MTFGLNKGTHKKTNIILYISRVGTGHLKKIHLSICTKALSKRKYGTRCISMLCKLSCCSNDFYWDKIVNIKNNNLTNQLWFICFAWVFGSMIQCFLNMSWKGFDRKCTFCPELFLRSFEINYFFWCHYYRKLINKCMYRMHAFHL